ncbi:hypothetical protein NEHOM01_0587 [Nematocida homosporus]|uniref:uncharacterized protein n=1 Tax=Nematocida homosporus TaxID=1912981 RepID=UPI00221F2AD2|nr:uncharacterized protein NEHOM01_0587 [Nematocida homosporus]KAI5185082.1 hypothetical protein NEHOM01_0587 [Nematocida homosporus]
MKLSFESMGIGLAWLLSWSSSPSSAKDTSVIRWWHECAKVESGHWLARSAIVYESERLCPNLDTKDLAKLNGPEGRALKRYIQYWKEILKTGPVGPSGTQQLVAILDNCQRISSPHFDSCPIDLEKYSLSQALIEIADSLKEYQALIQAYAQKLTMAGSAPNGYYLKHLFEVANSEQFGDQYKISTDDIRGFFNDFITIKQYTCNFNDLTENDIEKAVRIWKEIVENPDRPPATNKTFCVEKQLRHFLYRVMKGQLFALNFLDLPKSPIGRYCEFQVNSEQKIVFESFLDLKMLDLMTSLPAKDAAQKIYRVLKSISDSPYWVIWNEHVDKVQNHLDNLHRSLSTAGTYDVAATDHPKQRSDALMAISDHAQAVLTNVYHLRDKLVESLAVHPNNTNSIHSCVDYLITKPNPDLTQSPSNTISESTTLNELISESNGPNNASHNYDEVSGSCTPSGAAIEEPITQNQCTTSSLSSPNNTTSKTTPPDPEESPESNNDPTSKTTPPDPEEYPESNNDPTSKPRKSDPEEYPEYNNNPTSKPRKSDPDESPESSNSQTSKTSKSDPEEYPESSISQTSKTSKSDPEEYPESNSQTESSTHSSTTQPNPNTNPADSVSISLRVVLNLIVLYFGMSGLVCVTLSCLL